MPLTFHPNVALLYPHYYVTPPAHDEAVLPASQSGSGMHKPQEVPNPWPQRLKGSQLLLQDLDLINVIVGNIQGLLIVQVGIASQVGHRPDFIEVSWTFSICFDLSLKISHHPGLYGCQIELLCLALSKTAAAS